jgi:hypothetical protein
MIYQRRQITVSGVHLNYAAWAVGFLVFLVMIGFSAIVIK